MYRLMILLPLGLAACMAAGPEAYEPLEVAPVTRGTGWAGCEAVGGTFQSGTDGGLICVAQ